MTTGGRAYLPWSAEVMWLFDHEVSRTDIPPGVLGNLDVTMGRRQFTPLKRLTRPRETPPPKTFPQLFMGREDNVLNAGDTAWVLASAALVMLMTPGLAFFYGGMVRVKSVLNMLMMNFIALAVVGVLWTLYGFSMSFGNDAFGAS